MGLIPPEGIDLKDGALFQHRPCFDPPGCPPGYVAKARAAFDMKIAAREARKLIMNITYKCANRCVFCATGDRISAALGVGQDRRDPARSTARRAPTSSTSTAASRRLHPRLVGCHRAGARARLPLDQRHDATAACCATARSPSAC